MARLLRRSSPAVRVSIRGRKHVLLCDGALVAPVFSCEVRERRTGVFSLLALLVHTLSVYLLYWYKSVVAPVFSCEVRERHTGVFSFPALLVQKYKY
jgi:hypothetical protein